MAHQPKTLSKVPEVTAYFWIIKILTTGMGETTSDYFIHRVSLTNTAGLLAVATITGLALVTCLAAQVAAGGYQAPVYRVHDLFAFVLAAVFVVWNRSE